MMIGGRPAPKNRYATGHVRSYSYDNVFGCWRVDVDFDEGVGGFYGHKIRSTSVFAWMLHVVGDDGPAFSEMAPGEIDSLYHSRRAHYMST